jgi:hypothetical protein
VIRLYVACEGATEEEFVTKILKPHLFPLGINTFATQVGTPRKRTFAPLRKGGGGWKYWEKDLRRLLRSRADDVRVTTMFDLYGLPAHFPGLDRFGHDSNTNQRCEALETALAEHLDDRRFVPYLQRHEFEALVLCALPELRKYLDAQDDLVGLDKLLKEIGRLPPEEIDDGPTTAPSKRLNRIPGYKKEIHGPQALESAGLATLRGSCPRFNIWVTRLETLNREPIA